MQEISELSEDRAELLGLFRQRYPGGNAEQQLRFCIDLLPERVPIYLEILNDTVQKDKGPSFRPAPAS